MLLKLIRQQSTTRELCLMDTKTLSYLSIREHLHARSCHWIPAVYVLYLATQNGVTKWHQKNIKGEEVDSQMEWQALMNSMGPFRQELKAVRLFYWKDGSIVRANKNEGLAMEVWASWCGGLSDILSNVKANVSSGEFECYGCRVFEQHRSLGSRCRLRFDSPQFCMC